MSRMPFDVGSTVPVRGRTGIAGLVLRDDATLSTFARAALVGLVLTAFLGGLLLRGGGDDAAQGTAAPLPASRLVDGSPATAKGAAGAALRLSPAAALPDLRRPAPARERTAAPEPAPPAPTATPAPAPTAAPPPPAAAPPPPPPPVAAPPARPAPPPPPPPGEVFDSIG